MQPLRFEIKVTIVASAGSRGLEIVLKSYARDDPA